MEAAELKKLTKDLTTAASSGSPQVVVGILAQLKKRVKATEELLRETRAGVAVGKLRTHAAKEVSDLAKELVRKWKAEVEVGKKGKAPTGEATTSSAAATAIKRNPSISTAIKREGDKSGSKSASPATPSTPLPMTPSSTSATSLPTAQSQNPSVRSMKSDGVKVETKGDKTRDTCLALIYDALASDSNAPSDQILSRATGIEVLVFAEFDRSTAGPYRGKMRRLYLNLKDKNNPSLRAAVVSGALAVQRFCTMSVQEMASEERRQADSILEDKNMHNSLGAGEQEAETDAFKCGRCGQRKTRYRQAQTRSADEPMTTFVTCTNCNHRWKFS
ncbi:hypothetical protein BOTBODRAFT_39078 [Botryobasidium botryosum FD-172 SS1]|uniref:Transcription elongation factor n=1 Tax=Botryobasidium botryosum (strain FD-172 SS1) TaxID=930990 RepID=A0A067M676_BOTB1|nr:hypothetical protein BOTBODRAFT_39078 [Botryobasidium botryosum FD-172 SS1]